MNELGGGGKASTAKAKPKKSRNNRNRQRRNKRERNQNPRHSRGGPPQSPQTKVTFRNIGNPAVYGAVEGVAGIIRTIVEKANERLTGAADKKMLLDEESLTKLIGNDKIATQAHEKWKKNKTAALEDVEGTVEADKTEDTVDTTQEIVKGMNELDLKSGKIIARPLYVVAPKKTRRRGEKPGIACILLTTLAIEAIELPPVPEPESAEPTAEDGTLVEVKTDAPLAPPKADYSRQIAERQLALIRAVETMATIADADAKSDQVWAGCQVEESRNPKSWRPPQQKDSREGTVEESPGFQAFLEMRVKGKEELQSRPKPAPGGGLSAYASAGVSGNTSEDGKAVAAIVLHLRSKYEHEKQQKKNKRKAKDAKKKAAVGENPTGGKKEGGNRKTRRPARSKTRARARSNANSTSQSKAEAKPGDDIRSSLLKLSEPH
jgi:hypothetical protein